MKDMKDINLRLRNELDQWFANQIRNEYEDYYLYYLPTTKEHIGGLLICKEKPANPEYQLSERVRKDCTKDQNFLRLSEACRRLPILE
jgi:hypothetical protein